MLVSRTIPFRFEVAANTTVAKASLPLETPATIQDLLLIFPTNTQNKLIYRFFRDAVAKVPATGAGGGRDLWEGIVEKGEFVGENVAYVVPHHVGLTDDMKYLKFEAQNATGTALIAASVIHVIVMK